MSNLVNVRGRTFDIDKAYLFDNQLWKLIPCDGVYWVSSKGNIWSTETMKYLKPTLDGDYYIVTLPFGDKYKKRYIHRLVAEAFIPEIPGKYHINHIDEDPSNNAALNLEWVTPIENINHGTHNLRVSQTLKRYYAEKAMS